MDLSQVFMPRTSGTAVASALAPAPSSQTERTNRRSPAVFPADRAPAHSVTCPRGTPPGSAASSSGQPGRQMSAPAPPAPPAPPGPRPGRPLAELAGPSQGLDPPGEGGECSAGGGEGGSDGCA